MGAEVPDHRRYWTEWVRRKLLTANPIRTWSCSYFRTPHQVSSGVNRAQLWRRQSHSVGGTDGVWS